MSAVSRFVQAHPGSLTAEFLPDGSTAVLDTRTGTIHALNAPAAAAFAACRTPQTCPELVRAMQEAMGQEVTADLALAAVAELQAAGLLIASGAPLDERSHLTRRALLKAAGVALPTVWALTASQQRAHAQGAGSGTGFIRSVTPNASGCSFDADVVVTGENTHFNNSSVVVFSKRGGVTHGSISTSNVRATSATSLTVRLTFMVGEGGELDVTVTTGSEVAVGNALFDVESCV
ncbi:MAG: hypothetical protein KBA95_12590 [Acidobacteria bacterium]|nr:hypothetical protein [Acidobacteriota bacterium]